jgi:hypothetical protein
VQRLFALDQGFPQPIVEALSPWITEAELVPIREIDRRLAADMDDWEVLLALHLHERPWDGLITTDSSILNLPREMSVLRQTNLTLVAAHDSGHDPLKASGLLLAHLPWICSATTPDRGQYWKLSTRNQPAKDPWEALERIADHQNLDVEYVWRESRLTRVQMATNPLLP